MPSSDPYRSMRVPGARVGELGTGDNIAIGIDEPPAVAPVVSVGGSVEQIDAGRLHSCVLLSGRLLRCSGDNSSGQLGRADINPSTTTLPSAVPPVDIGGAVVQVAAGNELTCALLDGGAVRCWGNNLDGQLGYGHTNNIGDDELPSAAGDVPLF